MVKDLFESNIGSRGFRSKNDILFLNSLLNENDIFEWSKFI